jgi:oxygen-independent coproporphyrinogen III oxidase
MNDSDLIQESIAEFETKQYADVLLALALPRGDTFPRCNFNTIFCKEPRQLVSFDYLTTIRKTSSQNCYFHVPFCRTECLYCSYEKIPYPTFDVLERYLHALESEIERKRALLKDDFNPDIFYVGGGTPTVLPHSVLCNFLQVLGRNFDLKKNLEFTVETTPQAILGPDGLDTVVLLKESGVNRINVGVQSISEKVTRQNGRLQSKDDVIQCFRLLRDVGFEKINLDLMYGLIGQSMEVWQNDLRSAVALGPDSITAFSLRVRAPSALFTLATRGEVALPAEKEVLTMRIMAQQYLPRHGFIEDNADYFIKSPDKRYLYQPFQPHNIHRNLIGFGPSAYTLAGDSQTFNIRATSDYLRVSEQGADPVDFVISLNRDEYMRKRLAEGLRTAFHDDSFGQEFGCSIFDFLGGVIRKLQGWELVTVAGPTIKLTFKGKIVHDQIAEYIKYSAAP